MRIFRATLETRHFSFEAFGKTVSEAADLLERGLMAHAKAYRMTGAETADFVRTSMADLNVETIRLGECTRDGCVLALCSPHTQGD